MKRRCVVAFGLLGMVGCETPDSGWPGVDVLDQQVVDQGRADAGVDRGVDGAAVDAAVALDAAVDAEVADATPMDAAIDADRVDAEVEGPRTFADRYDVQVAFTEGGIYDPVDHAFYVGSLASGGVFRVDAGTGRETTLFLPDEPGVWWTLGMDVDVVARRLWVCAMDDRRALDEAHDYAGYLWGFDLESGRRVAALDLREAAEGATCTDVAVADDGRVFVNDRQNPRLYLYEPRIDVLSLYFEHEALAGAVVGQNALVMLPDQSGLLSLVYLPSKLVHVSVPGRVVTEVEIEGDFLDALPPLSGADGMALDANGSLLVAFTSQLNRLRFVNGFTRAVSSTIEVEPGITDVVHTPGGNYLLNGQAVDFALDRTPEPSALVRIVDGL